MTKIVRLMLFVCVFIVVSIFWADMMLLPKLIPAYQMYVRWFPSRNILDFIYDYFRWYELVLFILSVFGAYWGICFVLYFIFRLRRPQTEVKNAERIP